MADSNIPTFFEPLLTQQYASEDVQRILEGTATRRKTTLRANRLLSDREEVAAALDEAGIVWSPVSWFEDAFVIEDSRERELWDLPAYKEGKLYLQSLSSMLPPLGMDLAAGLDVLDMCAAPGGKTTQIASLCPGAHITACEMNAPRAEKLEYNLSRQGVRGVNVMRTDARRLDDFFSFDRVLLDAPCSGSGTIYAQDPKLAKRFNQGLLDKCSKSQRALLKKALSVLKPGGKMVYSTCSVLARENEDALEEALKAVSKRGSYRFLPVPLGQADGIPVLPTRIEGTLAVCPTQLYEGFFMACIQRTA